MKAFWGNTRRKAETTEWSSHLRIEGKEQLSLYLYQATHRLEVNFVYPMRILIAIPLLVLTLPVCAQATKATMQTPEEVHNSALVIDTHADTPTRMIEEHYDPGGPLKGGQLNLESARQGNLGAEFFSIWVDPERYQGHYAHQTLEMIDAVKQLVARHPDAMVLATSPAEIEAARREHKFAALMGLEGGHSIESSLPLLRQYYALGVRYMTLTWSNSNGWADSSGDIDKPGVEHTKEGLTEFGKDVVYEMNRMGMMVDISHVSDKTFYRTLVISRAPVIASHSSARAICDAPRNMSDAMLQAVARSGGPDSKGGVVMVNFYSAFLSQSYRDQQKALQPELEKEIQALKDKAKAEGKEVPWAEIDQLTRQTYDRIPRPPLSILVDHIDHIAKVAGVDHVGLGSDFDGIEGQLPEGLNSAADLPKITAALMTRGYSAGDCHKILGGNLMRVFREVEQVSSELQQENRPRITEKQPFDSWKQEKAH